VIDLHNGNDGGKDGNLTASGKKKEKNKKEV